MGVVVAVQSVPVQYVAHSPTLKFVGQWLGPVLILGLLATELAMQKSSWDMAKNLVVRLPYQASSHLNLAVEAAKQHDYRLAEVEYSKVLGTSTEGVEKVIFPRQFVEGEIADLKVLLEQKPGYRDVLLRLALKYWQIGEIDEAIEVWEEARKLDPNNAEVIKTGELFL